MPVSLGLSITQNSQNSTAKTTNVTVALTLYWTGGSYNGYSKPGTVTIDGTAYDFTASFNYANGSGPVSTSGSAVVFTKTLNIAHNSDGTKTLYCSATYESGVSSGTVTTSNSRVLTPFSSGGSTGGDTGGGSGSNDDTIGDPTGLACYLIGGYHPSVSYSLHAVTSTGIVSFNSGDYVYVGTPIQYRFVVEDGYEVTEIYLSTSSGRIDLEYYVDDGVNVCEFVMPKNHASVQMTVKKITDCTIKISEGDHTSLIVRTRDTGESLSDGDTVPVGTAISTFFYADAGYELTVTINGEPIDISYGNWVFVANTHSTITTTATRIAGNTYPVNIDTGSEFVPYEINIDNGSGWDVYAAFIDDGTSWKPYS